MIKSKLVCKLVIQINNNVLHFTVFNDVVEFSFTEWNSSQTLNEISDNDLKLSLLKCGPITMLVDKSSKVVTQFL